MNGKVLQQTLLLIIIFKCRIHFICGKKGVCDAYGGTVVCCDGYRLETISSECIECSPGFYAFNCSEKCEYPLYGFQCEKLCQCSAMFCDFRSGCTSNSSDMTRFDALLTNEISTLNDRNNGCSINQIRMFTTNYNPLTNAFLLHRCLLTLY
ncbi:uncharacterized protein LOC134272580 [Saccostrea cucullata]|uniref:uncharacterized protein LOC134272580 n=1 Tax=Saccostrea cuccullata TaxID=36930 RepID=UPI002ED44E57